MEKYTPGVEVQSKAVSHILATFSHYSELLQTYRSKWYDLFRATYVFENFGRQGSGHSQIFFPKCYEQVEKVHARITGANPKFVLSSNIPIHPQSPETDMVAVQNFNQMALNYFWKMGNCQERFENWAKLGLIYNIGFAKVKFEQQVFKRQEKELKKNKRGEQVEQITEIEEVVNEYPSFEVPDIFDVYFDPRVEQVNDMMAIIQNEDQVKLRDLLKREDIYFNLDKLNTVSGEFSHEDDNYKMNKFSEQGVPYITDNKLEQYVTLRHYYGYFSDPEKEEDARCYYMVLAGDSVLIRMEEIDFIPFEKFSPTSIPNQTIGMGIVEPVRLMQDAYNLTRNQRFENVSMVINRMWLIKHGTGIDPRRLQSKAGQVIFTKDIDGIQPLATPDVTASSYQEANAINSEIQQALGTIDATQASSSESFTNTATGERIRWSEYNSRFRSIKRALERALGRLGEKMLMMTGKKATQNPLVQDPVTEQFFEVAKTNFDSVTDFFSVSVLADSTEFDSIDNKRENDIAFLQMAITMQSQGVPIDMVKIWNKVAKNFGENGMEYISQQPQQPQGGKQLPEEAAERAIGSPSPEEQLTEELTQMK